MQSVPPPYPAQTIIQSLHVYPIKGCRGIDLTHATLGPWGLLHDRTFMVVDAQTGRFHSQRDLPAMARLIPSVSDDGATLTVQMGGAMMPPLMVALAADAGAGRDVSVWSYAGQAQDAGDGAAAWMSDALHTACRLVRVPAHWGRVPKAAGPDDRVAFADGYPLLVTTDASLADLNQHLVEAGADPVPMNRFRPNVVLAGTVRAWAEDGWETLTVPAAGCVLRVGPPCARCLVTTHDQHTGDAHGPEPLRTLAHIHKDAHGKVNFGMNVLHTFHTDAAPVVLRVGDTADAAVKSDVCGKG